MRDKQTPGWENIKFSGGVTYLTPHGGLSAED